MAYLKVMGDSTVHWMPPPILRWARRASEISPSMMSVVIDAVDLQASLLYTRRSAGRDVTVGGSTWTSTLAGGGPGLRTLTVFGRRLMAAAPATAVVTMACG